MNNKLYEFLETTPLLFFVSSNGQKKELITREEYYVDIINAISTGRLEYEQSSCQTSKFKVKVQFIEVISSDEKLKDTSLFIYDNCFDFLLCTPEYEVRSSLSLIFLHNPDKLDLLEDSSMHIDIILSAMQGYAKGKRRGKIQKYLSDVA